MRSDGLERHAHRGAPNRRDPDVGPAWSAAAAGYVFCALATLIYLGALLREIGGLPLESHIRDLNTDDSLDLPPELHKSLSAILEKTNG